MESILIVGKYLCKKQALGAGDPYKSALMVQTI